MITMLTRYITIEIDSTREAESPMKVMKRNGTEVIFDITKIIAAITKANNTIEEDARSRSSGSRSPWNSAVRR